MPSYHGWDHMPTKYLFEAIDPAEFIALTEGQKDYIRIMLSCGTIDFHEGSLAHTVFDTYFPPGSNTHDKVYLLTYREYDIQP